MYKVTARTRYKDRDVRRCALSRGVSGALSAQIASSILVII